MATPEPVPCGSWKSPITVELITAQTLTLWQTWIDGADVYWVEGRPLEGGRNALVRLSPGSGPVDCLLGDRNVHQAELYFYSQIFKFDLAEDIEPLEICNL